MSKKKLLITSGDPAGCGPIIAVEAIREFAGKNIDFFLVGDHRIYSKIPLFKKIQRQINFIDVCTPAIGKLKPGGASRISGAASLKYLKEGIKIIKTTGINRLVTAPLSKEAVKLVSPGFFGHTEYLAKEFKSNNVEMMFVSGTVKIVTFTRHIPLRRVSSSLKVDNIFNTLTLVYSSLKDKFKIRSPKIAFSSFNPHAGIDTFFDKEEKIISSAIRKFPKKVYGPYPSDSLFLKKSLKEYDCIICLYHDQAMIPFKSLFWHKGVNITLGLPIIRTSPVHGVAYKAVKDKQRISHSSMVSAMQLALRLSP